MTPQDILGYCAAALTTGSFLPQALLTLRTRDVSGISIGMYGAFTAGVALWLMYGVALGNWPIVAANAVTPVDEPAEEVVAQAFEAPVEAPAEIVAQAPAEIVAQAPVPVAAPPVFKAQPARTVHSRAAPSGKAKAAFTLRLAPDRHLKLRLACATTNRSAQMLVTDALDAFLATMPELDAMAKKVPTPSATQAADKE